MDCENSEKCNHIQISESFPEADTWKLPFVNQPSSFFDTIGPDLILLVLLRSSMIFESILNIIRKAQDRHPTFSMRMAEAEALGRWPIAVGEVIAKHARAIRVKDSILWVEVEHPIWRS